MRGGSLPNQVTSQYKVTLRVDFADWLFPSIEWGWKVYASSPRSAVSRAKEAAQHFAAGLEIKKFVILSLKEMGPY